MRVLGPRRRPIVGVCLTGFALLASGCGNGGSSPSGSAAGSDQAISAGSLEEVCEAGRQEGQVFIRRGSDAEVFNEMVKPFEEKFGIDVKFNSMKPPDNVQNIIAQLQTGNKLDIDGTDFDIPSAQPLLEGGLVADVDWPALGIAEDLLLDVKDLSVYRTNRNVLGLGYNTTMISEQEMPSTWDELNDPKWNKQVIVDPRGKYLSSLAVEWGEDQTIEWYAEFLDNVDPVPVEGATASLQKIIAGEVPISASAHDNEVLEQQAKGAPVEIKYLDVVPAQDNYAFVLKDAPNPNAVRCFYGWWGGDEGSAQQLKHEFKSNGLSIEGLKEENKLSVASTSEEAELQSEVSQKLSEMTLNR